MIYELLKNISEHIGHNGNYCIERQLQLAYSAAGKMALSALHDIYDKNNLDISIQHFKSRAEEVFNAFLKKQNHCLDINAKDIAEEIYSIYLKTGYIYHKNNKIRQAQLREEQAHGVCFLRGLNPWEKSKMSGLGMYNEAIIKKNDSIESTAAMFGLQEEPINSLAKRLIKDAIWNECFSNSDDGIEFMSMNSFEKGYWISHPDKKASVSLMRTSIQPHKYFMYRYDNGKRYSCELPEWMTDNGEFLLLCNAILEYNSKLPAIKYSYTKNEQFTMCVNINLSYLLPPSEMNFMRLYSWPASFIKNKEYVNSGISDFKRIMKAEVFSALKKLIERSGWIFKEE